MYNIDFLHQIEEFRRNLFGSAHPDEILPEFQFPKTYSLPNNVEIVPCYEAPNGEWVPVTYITSELEEKVNSK